MMKKGIDVIGVSLLRGRKWYEWEWVESDGLFFNDGDVYED